MNIFLKTLKLLDPGQRGKTAWIFFLVLLSGIFETLGLASILPFITILSNPEAVAKYQSFYTLVPFVDFTDQRAVLIFWGGFFLAFITFVNAFNAFAQAQFIWFGNMQTHYLSQRLLRIYINRPYRFFLDVNSADLAKDILKEVGNVVKNVIVPLIHLISRLAIVLFVLGFMLWADAVLTLLVIGVFVTLNISVYWIFKKKLKAMGEATLLAATERFKAISEIFSMVKYVKLSGRQDFYIGRYDRPSYLTARYLALHEMINSLPRYLYEIIAYLMVVIILVYLLQDKGSLSAALPTAALFALAGQRILPSFHHIFSAMTKIQFSHALMDHILRQIEQENPPQMKLEDAENIRTVHFQKEIRFEDIEFSYNESQNLIHQLNLTFQRDQTYGFVGSTGSGKTTLTALLMGLLQPHGGRILVDDVPLDESNVRAWQDRIGYVSQQIILLDDSVARNIAFGLTDQEINIKRVEDVAKMAQLHDFITHELGSGYDTKIGENGQKLSGGQRQRLAIARALYQDPDLLILDEATSALDNKTEDAIMRTIQDLSGQKTILIVAHRFSTIKHCHRIFFLKEGKISGSGTYQELYESNPEFQEMAKFSEFDQ
jgi:ABC-type multidrug transport system fused ATPase/permease subunit